MAALAKAAAAKENAGKQSIWRIEEMAKMAKAARAANGENERRQ